METNKKQPRSLEKLVVDIYTAVGAVAMGLLAIMVIFAVVFRYCFGLNWKQVSEFNVTLFAFTTFWGLGLNILKNEHVSINMLYDILPTVVKKILSIVDMAVVLTVDGFFTYFSYNYAMKMGIQISQGMEIPMVYMYGIMPVCGAIAGVCAVIKLIEAIVKPLSAYETKTDDVKADA